MGPFTAPSISELRNSGPQYTNPHFQTPAPSDARFSLHAIVAHAKLARLHLLLVLLQLCGFLLLVGEQRGVLLAAGAALLDAAEDCEGGGIRQSVARGRAW